VTGRSDAAASAAAASARGDAAAVPAGADPEALVSAAQAGDPRALARLVSLIEDDSPLLRPVIKIVAPMTGHAHVVGLTGAPGVGKSTVTAALVRSYRTRGQRVGVLAVDPSSPFSGGALLGDRVRMQEHATDDGVFIRSMASRGHLGGLAAATPQAVRMLDAAGFDVVLVETVGVGQAEVEIASAADTALVVLAPGLGDSIQAAKAGILEIADIFVVNKSDRPGAHDVTRDLRNMLAMVSYGAGGWKPPIVGATAVTGVGIDELALAIDSHRGWLTESGQLQRRRTARARGEISAIAVGELQRRADGLAGASRLDELAEQVCAGTLDPYAAADELIATSQA
jgi:LAO/AO transport system kinase